jgi:transposase
LHHLDEEIADLEALIHPLVTATAPELLAHKASDPTSPPRYSSRPATTPHVCEATFARLWGAAPIPATIGKTQNRHRLHRGGDRQANSALWRIALTRMSWDPDTRAYVERRTEEGLPGRCQLARTAPAVRT